VARRSLRLTTGEQQRITGRAAALEAATGAQVLAVVAGKSDAYPEIPWKAFALGAVTAVLALAAGAMLGARWVAMLGPVAAGAIVLAVGAVPALLTVFCLPFARLFLDRHRAEAEVRQHAETLFRSHGLDRTRARVGVLLLLSLFERRACLLPDAAMRDRVSDTELADGIARITQAAARGEIAAALLRGLDALEALLADKGFRGPGGPDEIIDTLIQDPAE
jgi:putative membrane protein